MKPIEHFLDLHRKAMKLAAKADSALADGLIDVATGLYGEAFVFEREYAEFVISTNSSILTKSVMIRSAASLGYQAGLLREAEKLVGLGLSIETPYQIAEELRDLYENITMGRHLEQKGIKLSSVEFRMSISGNIIGHGIAPSSEVKSRQEIAEKLAFRTAERLLGNPYREHGKVDPEVKKLCEPFQYVPEAASFAIVFRLGSQEPQINLFEGVLAEKTITSLIEGLDLVAKENKSGLEELIPDEKYRTNFVYLAKSLAPDGDKVKQVGFTALKNGEPFNVPFRKTQKEISESFFPKESRLQGNSRQPRDRQFTVIGDLRGADETGRSDQIKIVTESEIIAIKVPEGLGDMVRIYWGTEVVATGRISGRNRILENISLP